MYLIGQEMPKYLQLTKEIVFMHLHGWLQSDIFKLKTFAVTFDLDVPGEIPCLPERPYNALN